MAEYQVVAELPESTVVGEYMPEARRDTSYQSEADLEEALLSLLESQGYERLYFHTEAELIANLRRRLEILNDFSFTDAEWKRFFSSSIANPTEHIREKARKVHEDYVQVLRRDDGSSKNILLLDHKQIHRNFLQVLNQYEVGEASGARHKNRYDVTILVNGFPMVHIELKRRGVAIREAFHQIRRYQRDSFWAGSGLFEYVQIFVISNGTHTKYYSNTTRDLAVKEAGGGAAKKKSSAGFDFTSFWADAKNRIIPDLVDFAKTFLARHTILSVLTRYSVFTSEDVLMVMRPYQITATERILNRIEIATNYKKYGTTDGGGYIWHTTGSGKTLTSFKTAQLASQFPFIDRVIFVVDRKDLDYQTMREYDRFEKGAANSNTSTAILTRQLSDSSARIIITTIQKLSQFIKKNPEHPVYAEHVVMIFDECHRSQFGDMHGAIVSKFKKYHIFGFTGTPIFAKDMGRGVKRKFLTTDQTFGDRLHVYTIVDAINDRNVLPFHIDYIRTMDHEPDVEDKDVYDIDREKAFCAPERIRLVTKYILEHFNQKTYRGGRSYWHSVLTNAAEVAAKSETAEVKEKRRISGFNAIFCVSSVAAARLYYREFQKQMAENPAAALRMATIFSYAANQEESEDDFCLGEENSESTADLSATDRDFLDEAIADYNGLFGTNYSTDAARFQNYYKDVSLRMKNKELDLLLVVNMFLTGFDAPTLNTLWVDKNLQKHGLIQAFSRTNRILNRVKAFGNIICFRNLQRKVDEALGLYGDREAGGVVVIRSFKDYYEGYTDDSGKRHPGYRDLVSELTEKFPLSEPQIVGEKNQEDFLALFGSILRLRNLLLSFDEFSEEETFSPRDFQDYLGRYQDVHDAWVVRRKAERKEPEDITGDVAFETELVRELKVDVDYILLLVAKYHESNKSDAELLVTIRRTMDASPELRSKKDLVFQFIESLNQNEDVPEAWQRYIFKRRREELAALIDEEKLKEKETIRFVENSFREGEIRTTGTAIEAILPPMSRFGGGNREEKKNRIIEKLKAFLSRFLGLCGNSFSEPEEEAEEGGEVEEMHAFYEEVSFEENLAAEEIEKGKE